LPELEIRKTRVVGHSTIDDQPITIGRAPDNTIVLESSKVSRNHCVIESRDGRWHVRDLDSSHGTTVNGDEAGDDPLCHGDVIGVGRFVVLFKDPEHADLAAVPEDSAATLELEELHAEVDRLHAEIDRQATEIQVQQETAEQGAETLADRDGTIEEINARIAALEGTIRDLESARDAALTRAEEAERGLLRAQSTADQIKEASRQLAGWDARLTDLEAAWIEIDEQIEQIEYGDPEAIAMITAQRDALSRELENAHAACDAALDTLLDIVERADIGGDDAKAPGQKPGLLRRRK